jgi:hypothetical protein
LAKTNPWFWLSAWSNLPAGKRQLLGETCDKQELITGLIYFNEARPNLVEQQRLLDMPLVYSPPEKLRPARERLDKINAAYRRESPEGAHVPSGFFLVIRLLIIAGSLVASCKNRPIATPRATSAS